MSPFVREKESWAQFKSRRSIGHRAGLQAPGSSCQCLSLGGAVGLPEMRRAPEGKACGLQEPACFTP